MTPSFHAQTVFSLAALILLAALPSQAADILVRDAWLRETLSGQKTTTAYMRISVSREAKLLGARSSVAERVDLQEMVQPAARELLKRQTVAFVMIPAGRPFELNPVQNHFLLNGLRQPLRAGARVPLTLLFEQDGKPVEVDVEAVVRAFYAGKPADKP